MIRTIIVDDEKPSTAMLKKLLINSGKVDVVGCFHQSKHALEFLSKNDVDVAFLDIEIPDINGLELANCISEKNKLKNKLAIVFVTAYTKYAVEAFRINALDYLLKPIRVERLNETLDRIIQQLNISIIPAKIKIKCFGKFKIMAGDVEIKFRTKKALELIAFLIDKNGRSVSRSKIIDNLWSEFDGDKALINFNTTLYYARKALLQQNIDLPIIYKDSAYRLEIENIDCDFFSFMNCDLNNGEITKENIKYYEEIAALYIGDYFEANDYTWAEGSILNCKDKYYRLLLKISEYYVSEKQNSKAIEALKLGFSKEASNNKITSKLITLLVEEKNYSLAKRYYNLHKDETIKEFNIEPEESLKKNMISLYKNLKNR